MIEHNVNCIMVLFHNRPAWQVETSELRVTVMQCGGHVAETVYKPAGALNPLWIQDRPTIDSDKFDPVKHGEVYGTDSEARLISGLLGHNLCLPFWGPPSESEFEAGMTAHGETNVVRWKELSANADSLTIGVTLPHSGMRVERKIHCHGSVVFFDTTVENLRAWDQPVAWCEHVTVGPPFLSSENTGFYASLLNGFRTGHPEDQFRWPEGRGEIQCDLSRFSAKEHSDLVNSFRVSPDQEIGCFAAWNAQLGLLFGYAFAVRQFPWLNVWESNDRRRRTRGMEFSNTPVEGTLKQLITTPRVLDLPTFEWLDARKKLRKKFVSFSARIPEDYRGTAAIETQGDVLHIRERNGRSVDIDIRASDLR